jgi:hypothetical protein
MKISGPHEKTLSRPRKTVVLTRHTWVQGRSGNIDNFTDFVLFLPYFGHF